MKRVGNLYSKICDMENLKLAHQNARKGKGWYQEVKMVDEDPEKYLGQLQEMLSKKYIEPLEPYAKAYYEYQFKKGGKAA